MTTKQTTAQQLLRYLHHGINLASLVHWAEEAIMNGGFEQGQEKILREVLGKIAAADITDFGLLWEDCENLMLQLGYKINIDAALVA